jgi:large conductance mechanosensitive channel
VKFTFLFLSFFLYNLKKRGAKYYATLAEAAANNEPTINIGVFFNSIVHFIIIAFAIFLFVKQMNRIRRKQENAPTAPEEPATKECKYCLSTIPVKAVRCKHCTSQLEMKINLK